MDEIDEQDKQTILDFFNKCNIQKIFTDNYDIIKEYIDDNLKMSDNVHLDFDCYNLLEENCDRCSFYQYSLDINYKSIDDLYKYLLLNDYNKNYVCYVKCKCINEFDDNKLYSAEFTYGEVLYILNDISKLLLNFEIERNKHKNKIYKIAQYYALNPNMFKNYEFYVGINCDKQNVDKQNIDKQRNKLSFKCNKCNCNFFQYLNKKNVSIMFNNVFDNIEITNIFIKKYGFATECVGNNKGIDCKNILNYYINNNTLIHMLWDVIGDHKKYINNIKNIKQLLFNGRLSPNCVFYNENFPRDIFKIIYNLID
jgi:hypothetical protein